jgi:hypothetical protein
MFSELGAIDHVADILVPSAYSDIRSLETSVAAGAGGSAGPIRIGEDLGTPLRVLQKHCDYCHLSKSEPGGYALELPVLHPPLRALVHLKLQRLPASERS